MIYLKMKWALRVIFKIKHLKQWREMLSTFYVQSAVTKCYQGSKDPILSEIWPLTAFPGFADLTWEITET